MQLGTISLESTTSKEKLDVGIERFQEKTYLIFHEGDIPVFETDYFAYRPSLNFEMCVASIKGNITLDIVRLTEQYEEQTQWLQVQVAPKHMLYVSEDHAKHDVVLVPATTHIQHAMDIRKVPEKAIKLGCKKICDKDVYFYLTSQYFSPAQTKKAGAKDVQPKADDWKKNFVAPFWFIQESDDKEKVNIESFVAAAKTGPFGIPCYRNSKVVKKGVQLCVAKPVKKEEPDQKKARTK